MMKYHPPSQANNIEETITMTKAEIVKSINKLGKNNGAFYSFETVTTPKMTKKSRATKDPWTKGVVTIHSKFSGKLGVSYENCINNAKKRAGEVADFETSKPKGKHYVDGSKWLMASDADESKHYVAIDKVGGKTVTIMVGDRLATQEEIADLKANYFPTSSNNSVADKYGVTWRTYGVESIKAIK